ncbi:hypothetical protein GCM10018980_18890 [Streptomyces capoamus]|uniref:Uncharacterized protein n=1 Tax=Streptomyces capoamus TaxID=68183 RepID=A0A919C534_9ACTN|nr:hypothetical protein [Streptomyces capoamus]GGW16395.1 hypothetical protein GCM10010501_32490 [Streptomyces libani subsp. rufus]GHG42734.1 hypothetical protein GCM10018980_18890 [Streptomyces capoamus]
MSQRNTFLRSLHDLGLAAWFGGSLMGAVGLNGAARAEGATQASAARLASSGWAMWAPVNAAAVGTHLVGSSGLLAANAARVATQQGVGASTLAKTVLTGAALAATAYSRVLGKKIELASSGDPEDAEKAARHPVDTDKAQRQLTVLQWAVPALTGGLLILNALHGEQQRPEEQERGMWQRAMSKTPHMPPMPHMSMPSVPDWRWMQH